MPKAEGVKISRSGDHCVQLEEDLNFKIPAYFEEKNILTLIHRANSPKQDSFPDML
jgi:hypothetical protein